MAKYAIWDKASPVYTPSGEVFTSEQWLERYGWGNIPGIKMVLAGGAVNGALCGNLADMVEMYTRAGADFSGCETDEEILAAMEYFDDNPPIVESEPTAEERIAAALEYQNLMSMEDEAV